MKSLKLHFYNWPLKQAKMSCRWWRWWRWRAWMRGDEHGWEKKLSRRIVLIMFVCSWGNRHKNMLWRQLDMFLLNCSLRKFACIETRSSCRRPHSTVPCPGTGSSDIASRYGLWYDVKLMYGIWHIKYNIFNTMCRWYHKYRLQSVIENWEPTPTES